MVEIAWETDWLFVFAFLPPPPPSPPPLHANLPRLIPDHTSKRSHSQLRQTLASPSPFGPPTSAGFRTQTAWDSARSPPSSRFWHPRPQEQQYRERLFSTECQTPIGVWLWLRTGSVPQGVCRGKYGPFHANVAELWSGHIC